jgi:uncharacterized membrane protein
MNYQGNPYAPPQASPPVAPSATPFGAGQSWAVGEVLSIAWGRFKEHWVVLVFSYLLTTIVTQALSAAPRVLTASGALKQGSTVFTLASLVCATLTFGISVFLQAGLTRIWVDAALGQSPTFDSLFSQGTRALPLMGASLLSALAIFGGLLLLIVPGVIFAIGFCLAPYYVVDANMGPVRAMQASWAATRGQKGQIFVLGLACTGLTLLGLMACCVGLLGALPICTVALALVYVRLSGRGVAVQGPYATPAYPPPPEYGPLGPPPG